LWKQRQQVAGDDGEKVDAMEQLLLEKLELLHGDALSDPDTLLQTLASCRALVFNPASSEAAARSVFDALTHFVRHEHRPLLLRPALKLLGDTALRHPALTPSAVAAARPLLACGKRLAAEALAVLVSVAEAGGEGLSQVRSALGEHLVLSLASSRAVAVRSMLVKLLVLDVDRGGAGSFALGHPLLVVGVLLAFTADLYPSVRSAAFGGLLALCSSAVVELEVSVVQRCYDVAVSLLRDVDTSVRISAIRVVSELGGMLAASKDGKDSSGFSDAHFLRLCFFARDMNMKVRVEVFVALGRVKLVSECILLQSLSKKLLRSDYGGRLLAKCNAKESGPPLSCAAGVFVHGLEDEFHEVRRAACESLGKLTRISSKFANNSLNFLMDMLNDDSAAVQLETLRTLSQMAVHGGLSIPESHIHMDEEDVVKGLFCMGKTYGELAASVMKEYIQEIDSTSLGQLNLDRPRVAALLVLALSSTFSNGNLLCDIPPRVLSYAIPFLGRISRALQDLMSQDSLLADLCKLSGLPYSETESEFKEAQMEESEATLYEKIVISASKQILRAVAEIWHMIKARHTHGVLKILRACKEELEMIALGVNATYTAGLLFTLEYVQVVQLITEVWEQIQPKDSCAVKIRQLDLLLEKLETSLRKMRYCFTGLSNEEESHVVELTLLVYVLRLLKVGFWADPVVRKMQFMIAHLELIRGETCDHSEFVKNLKSLCSQGGMNDTFGCTRISDLLESFSLEQMMFRGKFRHTKAELKVLSEDSELPLLFIPGLPVGISFNITLYNVSEDARVWLKMAVGQSFQYAFLSLSQFDRSDCERRCIVEIPYFRTPKAAFFLLKARVCLECPCEIVREKTKGQGGPRHQVIFLCEEKDVYLADVGTMKHEP
ncbi:hypothetical protein Taro_026345, partial [Colocasia esculenta]|nr:hypothetical protein [Colocasia esculenta]